MQLHSNCNEQHFFTIFNENYLVAINQKGEGVSKYKDYYINRFKTTDDYSQGIFFDIKNIKSKKIWSSKYKDNNLKETKYKISFMPDKDEQEILLAKTQKRFFLRK